MTAKVLVIDDEAQSRDLVAAVLGPAGYAVRTAPGGVAGLTLAAADPPDVIVLDNRKAYAAGAQACVPKLFRQQGLLVAIRAALTRMPRQETPSG